MSGTLFGVTPRSPSCGTIVSSRPSGSSFAVGYLRSVTAEVDDDDIVSLSTVNQFVHGHQDTVAGGLLVSQKHDTVSGNTELSLQYAGHRFSVIHATVELATWRKLRIAIDADEQRSLVVSVARGLAHRAHLLPQRVFLPTSDVSYPASATHASKQIRERETCEYRTEHDEYYSYKGQSQPLWRSCQGFNEIC